MGFEEQIMSKDKYPCIFLKPNGGCCVKYPSNIFTKDLKAFKRQGDFVGAQNILLVYSKCLVLFILTMY